MTRYEYLTGLLQREQPKLLSQVGLDPTFKMKVYEFMQQNPALSQEKVGLHFGISKSYVQKICEYMDQEINGL